VANVPAARHLLRAKDLADARYFEPLTVADLAAAARLSPAHFSRQFKAAFGESPHQYLLTRRLERAAALTESLEVGGTAVRAGLPRSFEPQGAGRGHAGGRLIKRQEGEVV
jgi:AraC-like DNA-binding protein